MTLPVRPRLVCHRVLDHALGRPTHRISGGSACVARPFGRGNGAPRGRRAILSIALDLFLAELLGDTVGWGGHRWRVFALRAVLSNRNAAEVACAV